MATNYVAFLLFQELIGDKSVYIDIHKFQKKRYVSVWEGNEIFRLFK